MKCIATLALVCLCIAWQVEPPPRDALIREARIERVVDGDTFDAEVLLRYSTEHHGRFRVLKLDTPEMTGTEHARGQVAKDYAIKLLGSTVYVHGGTQKDSFGRWLVDVYLPDGRDFAATMIAAGHIK